jgi:addiction module HigA family antidote
MSIKLPINEPPHPGEILKEVYLDDLGITQTELSHKIGCTLAKVNEIINKKRGITPEFAVDIGQALGTGPELWANLQVQYDLWHAVHKKKKSA